MKNYAEELISTLVFHTLRVPSNGSSVTGEISTVIKELLDDLVVVRLLLAAANRIRWTMPLDRLAVSILEDSVSLYVVQSYTSTLLIVWCCELLLVLCCGGSLCQLSASQLPIIITFIKLLRV